MGEHPVHRVPVIVSLTKISQGFSKMPSPANWQAFVKNSPRVRSLDLVTAPMGRALGSNIINELARSKPPGELFPQLRQLKIPVRMLDTLFLANGLQGLHIFVDLLDEPSNCDLVSAAVLRVLAYSPNIERLYIDNRRRYHSFTPEFLPLLKHLLLLKTVSLPAQIYSQHLLDVLSQAPCLEEVWSDQDRRDMFVLQSSETAHTLDVKPVVMMPGSFPMIKSFGLCALTTAAALCLLLHPSFPSANLRSLTVQFTFSEESFPVYLPELFGSIEICMPRLEELDV